MWQKMLQIGSGTPTPTPTKIEIIPPNTVTWNVLKDVSNASNKVENTSALMTITNSVGNSSNAYILAYSDITYSFDGKTQLSFDYECTGKSGSSRILIKQSKFTSASDETALKYEQFYYYNSDGNSKNGTCTIDISGMTGDFYIGFNSRIYANAGINTTKISNLVIE